MPPSALPFGGRPACIFDVEVQSADDKDPVNPLFENEFGQLQAADLIHLCRKLSWTPNSCRPKNSRRNIHGGIEQNLSR